MPVEFTQEQLNVINSRNSNLLVSAAAGSGKTAVLVERIIRLITEDGYDIDRILVVTYTDAAALEMKTRISEAIEKCLREKPEDMHLQKQSSLLHKAHISTLHTFCINVIRNNFNSIGIDPTFRVAEDAEIKLMEEDVLNDLLEEKYESKEKDFIECVEYLCLGTEDTALRNDIHKLVEFAQGNPNPIEWLRNSLDNYRVTDVTQLKNTSYITFFMDKYVKEVLNDAREKAENAMELVLAVNGPIQYLDNIRDDIECIGKMLNIHDFEVLRDYITNIGLSALSRKKADGVDPKLKAMVQNIRNEYKTSIWGTKSISLKKLMSVSLEREIDYLKHSYSIVNTLIELCIEYMERFKVEKRSRGVISFSDMEHYALEILCSYDADLTYRPSDVAKEYQTMFDEILMDEYQDCNRVQELLISVISGENIGKYNRFMVGDVKQSIYKFRLSSPELFIDKYNSYRKDDSNSQQDIPYKRIDLHKNFRSRESVINTVNDLFSQIMLRTLGGVEYDKDAYLVRGGDFPEVNPIDEQFNNDTEILLAAKNSTDDVEQNILEARMIAQRIKELMKYQKVTDNETKKLRPLRYGDIAILLRSATEVAEGIKQVFLEEGIPFYLPMKKGFFETYEVQQIVELLKVIDNPLQDIPLFGVMKSYFGQFSDMEIANIRVKSSGTYLYEQLLSLKDEPKIERFLSFISDLRKKATYLSIHELLTDIIVNTHFKEVISAMSGGKLRAANLNLLLSKAAAYEGTSYKGLFHFVRFLNEIKEQEYDVGEADILGEGADVVRIMTIHKSKGLEFPVTILSGIHKQFNQKDAQGNVIVDMDLGLAVPFIDYKKKIKVNNLIRNIISLKLKLDVLGEEIRILYVALTRAKEKLIITGVVKEKDDISYSDIINKYFEERAGIAEMSFIERSEAKAYIDYIKPIMNGAKVLHVDDIEEGQINEALERLNTKEKFFESLKDTSLYAAEYEELIEKAQKRYKNENLTNLFLKTSVSALKMAHIESLNANHLAESTQKDKLSDSDNDNSNVAVYNISAADRGSAFHKIMELLDLNDADVKSQINKFVNNKRILKEWADAVPPYKIERFLASELGKRMATAQKTGVLKKEQPFVLGIAAKRVNSEYPESETVLLQGIIDAFFIEDKEIVLVDYKTDKVSSGEELLEKYKVQLDYYEEAIERITGYHVKESILYSFSLDTEFKR